MALILKIFRNQNGNRYGILLGNYLTCTVLAGILMPKGEAGFPVGGLPVGGPTAGSLTAGGITWLCGICAGILFVAGLVSMQGSVGKNGAILTSAFSKLGLIVPLLVSVLFFGERVRMIQIPGIILVLAAFLLISFDSEKALSFDSEKALRSDPGKAPAAKGGKVYPLLLLAVLVFCGGGDAMAKVFEETGQRAWDGMYFLILFAAAACLTLVLLLAEKKRSGKKVIGKEFAAGFLVGIPNYFSSSLLLKALTGLPAFVVYPCFSAGTLLLVTLIAVPVFKERPGVKTWTGLACITAALILLNI